MAGETIVVYGADYSLQSAGAGIPNNSLSAAAASAYSRATNGAGFLEADFVLNIIFATAPTAGSMIDLYAQELAIDGTNDEQAPTTTYLAKRIGSFRLNNVTVAQPIRIRGYQVPDNAKYYLYNNGSGQTSGAWSLIVKPRSYKAA